jgi:membrane-bound lytic murein transglycosylase D
MTGIRRHAIVAIATLLAAACAGPAPQVRDEAPEPAPPVAAPPAPGNAAEAPQEPAPQAVVDLDLWQQLREGLAFARCDAPPALVARHAQRLVADPAAFTRSLARAVPALRWVLRSVQEAGLPAEFALLPMVESGYRAVGAGSRGPAGYWQFVPVTARDYGLAIRPGYDARLDLAASTTAATRLLRDLGDRFGGNWTLATMAYNAGEYRVRRALREQGTATPDPDRLRLRPVTHAHNARLEAVSCIVAAPDRFGVALPPADASIDIAAVALSSSIALDDAAALAEVPAADVRALNAGVLGQRAPAGVQLLVPAANAAALQARLSERPAAAEGAVPEPDDHYIVQAGDSLWRIARRFAVSIDALRRWNGLKAGAILRPGQVLRVLAP